MPPKAQATAQRGRPKRSAAPEPAPVANASKKRGRVAKTQDADEVEVADPPKKRGRIAKAVVIEAAPKRGRRSNVAPAVAPVEEEASAPKKRMGRPPKKVSTAATATIEVPALKKRMGRPPKKETAPVDVPAAIPKARIGRPRKIEAAVVEESATPKRRGPKSRTSAIGLDLSRVAGSSRVTKSRSQPATKKAIPAPRLNPRLRAKLRTRQPPTPKVEQQVAPAPTKRRGRPPKAGPQQVAAPKQAIGRRATSKTAAKPVAPRKKRGYTALHIPDKYAAQIQRYLQELVEAEVVPISAVEEALVQVEEEDAGPGAAADEVEEVDVEEPITVVEEETVITSGGGNAADEEDVLALAEQLDGAEHSSLGGDLEQGADIDPMDVAEDIVAEVAEDIAEDIVAEVANSALDTEPIQATAAVEVELGIQETAQAEQAMIDTAEALESELNDKENALDGLDTRLSSEDGTDAYIGGAAPSVADSVLFGQEILSL
ncbi:hypothetical protein IQ06DRAFT_290516 [Phaeosphaeriaceae sp. SRC1lsM3a]|nr:hypothetical protein IQ06DRAFT_290516 [Stagonospora sp. SRC1lsM3a]